MDESEPGRGRFARFSSVRARTTLIATIAAGAAMTVAAVAGIWIQHWTLLQGVDSGLTVRADDLATLAQSGLLPELLNATDPEVSAVQVLDSNGDVVSATANVAGKPPIGEWPGNPGRTTLATVGALGVDDEDFRLLSRTVETQGGPLTLFVAGNLDDVNESVNGLIQSALIGLPLLAAFVAWTSWMVVGRALRPVEGIRMEVAGINLHDLARRVPEPPTNDEIGRLARTMNTMLGRLETSAEKQRAFVADASHELRSPLASIRTQLEVAVLHPNDADWARTTREALDEVERMQRLVDDLLLLARSDESPELLRPVVVDLDDIVFSEVRRLAGSTPKALDASGVSSAQVVGDGAQLTRAVRNVLENAARHARTQVVVTLSEGPAKVELTVEDDGPGVLAADVSRIFERFGRSSASRSREEGGAGLGLPIASAILSAHGGSVFVDPNHEGGARFVIHLLAANRPS